MTQTLRMISGRWKLPILFRLYADPAMRSSQLLRDIPGISHKMLTQHLRELEHDCLIDRTDFGEQPPRVEYRLTAKGYELMPVLMAARQFSENNHTRAVCRADIEIVSRARMPANSRIADVQLRVPV